MDFDKDVALNDMQLKTIQDVFIQMGMEMVTVVGKPVYPEPVFVL